MTETAIDPWAWLAAQANDPGVSWSVGTFGALAEFMRDADEPASVDISNRTATVVTARGAMRFGLPENARLFAYEGVSKLPAYWSHGVSLCMPVDDAALGGHTVLTTHGRDSDAIRDEDRNATLIDLGVGGTHIAVGVRTGDASLIENIQPYIGTPLFDAASGAPCILQAASPHRVFRSAAARIEVYGPIPDASEATENGPHTHLLPDLLAHDRPFAANLPIPDGWLPVLNLYPPNPARDGLGEPRPFDNSAHEAFQRTLSAFGVPALVEMKRQVMDAIRNGRPPDDIALVGRTERTAARVALRQLRFTDAPSDTLDKWNAALEPNGPMT